MQGKCKPRRFRSVPAFPHRRAIHRSVLVTLAAWVLALVAGFANACVLDVREPGRHGQAQVVDRDAHEAECNDSPDVAAFSIAKQAGHDKPDSEPAAVQTIAGAPNPVSVSVTTDAVDGGVHAHGPPDAIRFLRLRL
jgi:hypothetical protein